MWKHANKMGGGTWEDKKRKEDIDKVCPLQLSINYRENNIKQGD